MERGRPRAVVREGCNTFKGATRRGKTAAGVVCCWRGLSPSTLAPRLLHLPRPGHFFPSSPFFSSPTHPCCHPLRPQASLAAAGLWSEAAMLRRLLYKNTHQHRGGHFMRYLLEVRVRPPQL